MEAVVKPVKRSLLKVTKGCTLTFEELTTLFAQVEAALNSRPLCRSGDGYLTPGHFLVGHHLLLPNDFEGREDSLEQRKYLTDKMFRDFWKTWHSEYLRELNVRTQWQKVEENLCAGDIVVISVPKVKPTFWPIGRVMETFPGDDGLVRKAMVRIGETNFERPITS